MKSLSDFFDNKPPMTEVDILYAGDGWIFCSREDAEQWYDFEDKRWKDIGMANNVFRRRVYYPIEPQVQ